MHVTDDALISRQHAVSRSALPPAEGGSSASGVPTELLRQTGKDNLEDAFIEAIGSEEGLQ